MSMKVWAWWRAYDAWPSPAWSGTWASGPAHLVVDRVGRQERLGVHRVEVVDAVEERRLDALGRAGPG